jgi:Domain of unknown function (DUF4430)
MSSKEGFALLGVLASVWLLAGCGLGAGSAPSGVQLTVTSDFGAHVLASWSAPHARGEETVMSLLMRNAHVSTRYGGGFVQSIDGSSGGQEGSGQDDWFYYVNGVEAPKGAASTKVRSGDVIWWDLHDWSQAEEVPAVVGSFPEPFVGGVEGKRLPVRIECVVLTSDPCRTVSARFRSLGVIAGLASVGPAGEEPDTLRVVVGAWPVLRGVPAVQAIERGPGASGVYARLPASGSTLRLLNGEGKPARTLGAGAGLIAATSYVGEDPTWIITGTDAAGVDRAADALDSSDLRDRFALAIEPSGGRLPVPAA